MKTAKVLHAIKTISAGAIITISTLLSVPNVRDHCPEFSKNFRKG